MFFKILLLEVNKNQCVERALHYICNKFLCVLAVVLKTCEDFQFQSLVEFSLNEVDKKFLGIMVQFSSHPVIRINDVITELRKYGTHYKF